MVVDLALSSGERKSRSRRSATPEAGGADPTVRSVDFARPVEGPAAVVPSQVSRLSNAFSSFFGAAIGLAKKEEALANKQQNADEIARIEVQVRQDPEGAREAIQSGDFSKFIPDDEFLRRRVIQDSFKQLVGAQMAYSDYDNSLQEMIRGTSLDGDPDATIATFLEENLKGADPIFAQAYTRALSPLAAKSAKEFRTARLEMHQIDVERKSVELIRASVGARQAPATAEGLIGLRRQIIGALPMNAPDAVTRADALVDSTLIEMAADGDALALQLASLPDPNRDGTSVLSRNKGKLEQTVASFVSRKNALRSVAASDDLESMEDRLALLKGGLGNSQDSLSSLWADYVSHRQRYGDSEAADTMRDRIVAAMKSQSIDRGAIATIGAGRIPALSNTEWNKLASRLWDGEGRDELTGLGLSPEAAERRVMQALARRGSGQRLRDVNSARLLSSADAEEVTTTFTRLKALDIASDRPMKDLHLSQDAANLYHMMSWAETAGRDPLAVRRTFLQALNDTEGNARPDTHFEDRLTDPGKKDSKTYGRAGAMSVAKDVWEGIKNEDLKKPGFFARNFGFLGVGNSMPDFGDLSPAARTRITEAVNMASFMLSGQNASLDAIRALAGDMVQGEFGLELDANGNYAVTLEQTPPVVIGTDGSPKPAARVTAAVLDRAKAQAEKPSTAAVLEVIGGFAGLRQDSLTRMGAGLAVQSNATGFEQDVVLTPGGRIQVPISSLPADMPATFFEEVARDDKNDSVTFKIPDVPKGTDGRIRLDDSLFMYYDTERGGWTLRYQDPGAPKKSLRELSEENRRNRDAIFAERLAGPPTDPMRRKATLDAAEQSLREHEGLVGAPVPGQTDHGPPSHADNAGLTDGLDEALEELEARGMISPVSRLQGTQSEAENIIEQTNRAILTEQSRGGWLDDVTKPQNKRFLNEVADFVEEHEGRVPYVYDDRTRKRWSKSAKGNPTIGIGFNMNRPDARKLIKEIGGDYDKLMAGKEVLTDAQQNRLLTLTLRESVNWLRKEFKDVPMSNHRWLALLSLAYNSRWNGNGPTLITSTLRKLIAQGRWKDAAEHIKTKLLGGVPKSLLPGIRARRAREAAMFSGVTLEATNRS